MEIQRLSNHECWACGAGTTQVCYLIAVADTRTVRDIKLCFWPEQDWANHDRIGRPVD